MSRLKFTSRRHMFNRKNDAFKDMVMGHMAMDVERGIKTTAGTPVKTGDMKAETRHFRSPRGGFRVETDKEYAAVQELGRRSGSASFKNYTTTGTSAGWFKRAIDGVWKHQRSYIMEAKRALNL